MSVDLEYVNREIKGLPVMRVIEIDNDFDWHAVREAMGDNCITVKSEQGYVGLIFPKAFYLINNFKGKGETFVGIADELAEEYKLQMHYMGLYYGYEGFQVSDSDVDAIPRKELKFDPLKWYQCYAKDGIVVFVALQWNDWGLKYSSI